MAVGALEYSNQAGQQNQLLQPVILLDELPQSGPSNPTLFDIIVNFIADHATWARGNAFLIVAAIVTLVTLASLPIGGVPILFGLSVLAVAGIATGSAFLLWNLGCLIGNLWKGGGGGGGPSTKGDNIEENWGLIGGHTSSSTPQPRPEEYKGVHTQPPTSNSTRGTPQSPTDPTQQNKL